MARKVYMDATVRIVVECDEGVKPEDSFEVVINTITDKSDVVDWSVEKVDITDSK